LFPIERKQKIMDLLERSPAVKVNELSQLLQVSEVTIRRDLQELEEVGMLKRTHGGAINISTASFEPTIQEKEDKCQEEKGAISNVALDLIADDDTILLDSGSTTLQVAKLLRTKRKKQLTVITNALNIAWELASTDNIDLILTGGQVRHKTLSSVGPITEQTLSKIYVDKVLLATNGIDIEYGLTTPNMYEAQIKQKMIKAAREVIILADHSKFGRIALGSICPLSDVDYIITDIGAPQEYIKQLEDLGIQVIVAK
jgi:DeoR family fructose operon transcriptional repressor